MLTKQDCEEVEYEDEDYEEGIKSLFGAEKVVSDLARTADDLDEKVRLFRIANDLRGFRARLQKEQKATFADD